MAGRQQARAKLWLSTTLPVQLSQPRLDPAVVVVRGLLDLVLLSLTLLNPSLHQTQ